MQESIGKIKVERMSEHPMYSYYYEEVPLFMDTGGIHFFDHYYQKIYVLDTDERITELKVNGYKLK